MVTVRVGSGPEQKTLFIANGDLCHDSPFFKAALNGQFLEGQNQSITFEDVDPCVFEAYVHCVSRLRVAPERVYAPRMTQVETLNPVVLSNFWMLAERFMNKSMLKWLLTMFKEYYLNADQDDLYLAVLWIHGHEMAGPLLKQMLLDIFMIQYRRSLQDWVEEDWANMSEDLVLKIMLNHNRWLFSDWTLRGPGVLYAPLQLWDREFERLTTAFGRSH
jgi:hypothetical protein